MTSSAHEIRDLPGKGFAVVIQHKPHDSYSRSVQPCAAKVLQSATGRAALIRNGWDGSSVIYRDRWDRSLPDAPNGNTQTLVPFVFVKPEDWNS